MLASKLQFAKINSYLLPPTGWGQKEKEREGEYVCEWKRDAE